MVYNQLKQYVLSDAILQAVCDVGKVTFFTLCSTAKSNKLNILRGVYCLVTRSYCIHPSRAARMICRSRQNVINQARKYHDYVRTKDKTVMSVYEQVLSRLPNTKIV